MQFSHYLRFLLVFLWLTACAGKDMVKDETASAIIALAKLRSQAVVRSDTATLNSILDKNFRYINIFGESLSRDNYLKNNASLGSDSSYWISQDIDSMDVRVFNNSAVITFRVLDKFVYEGSPYENYCRSTFVYERQGDVWKCIIGHTTKIE
jgi:hypothetical protein